MQRISKSQLSRIAKLKQKKYRNIYKEFILSGLNVVSKAIESKHIKVKTIFVQEDKHSILNNLNLGDNNSEHITIFELSEPEFRNLSDEVNPQGIALLAAFPSPLPVSSDIVLYLDRINDPGNLGTIIRAACWFGIKDILLSPGSADPFQPKVVRSSAGLITHINIIEQVEIEDLKKFITRNNYKLVATYPGAMTPVSQLKYDYGSKTILAFGSEAHGLSKKIKPLIDQEVAITAHGPGESLNLAISVAIVLYQLSIRNE